MFSCWSRRLRRLRDRSDSQNRFCPRGDRRGVSPRRSGGRHIVASGRRCSYRLHRPAGAADNIDGAEAPRSRHSAGCPHGFPRFRASNRTQGSDNDTGRICGPELLGGYPRVVGRFAIMVSVPPRACKHSRRWNQYVSQVAAGRWSSTTEPYLTHCLAPRSEIKAHHHDADLGVLGLLVGTLCRLDRHVCGQRAGSEPAARTQERIQGNLVDVANEQGR